MTEPQTREADRENSSAGIGLTSRLDVNRIVRLMDAEDYEELRNHVSGLTLDELRRTLLTAVFELLLERDARADAVNAVQTETCTYHCPATESKAPNHSRAGTRRAST